MLPRIVIPERPPRRPRRDQGPPRSRGGGHGSRPQGGRGRSGGGSSGSKPATHSQSEPGKSSAPSGDAPQAAKAVSAEGDAAPKKKRRRRRRKKVAAGADGNTQSPAASESSE